MGPIGHGGVSVVYRALDTLKARPAAIKMLDPALAGDVRAQEKIRREALITDRVRHPSVPEVYEYGDAPLADGSVIPYVVMELIAGTVLASQLAYGALPWPDAVRIAATVADVLTVAHRRGVVHRDVSPANIMMTVDGAKIIDFGVAVTVEPRSTGPFVLPPLEVHTNDFAGQGEPADDVYALGVLLYQMLTGRSPYPYPAGEPGLESATLRFVAPTPVLAVPGLPRPVAEICRASMAKRPADRPDASSVALSLWSLIVPTPPSPSAEAGDLPKTERVRVGGHTGLHYAVPEPSAAPSGGRHRRQRPPARAHLNN